MDFTVWVKKDKTEIPVKQMTTLHIQNTIKMLNRRIEQNHAVKEFMDKTMDLLEAVIPVQEQVAPSFLNIDKSYDAGIDAFKRGTARFEQWISVFEQELRQRETN